ncbi:hypothetical protein TYRP_019388 [Tyrophagus putrescentiae]|nr:hypothetical protein TYRP_019388 [Tyrophagus putrescentiae]
MEAFRVSAKVSHVDCCTLPLPLVSAYTNEADQQTPNHNNGANQSPPHHRHKTGGQKPACDPTRNRPINKNLIPTASTRSTRSFDRLTASRHPDASRILRTSHPASDTTTA